MFETQPQVDNQATANLAIRALRNIADKIRQVPVCFKEGLEIGLIGTPQIPSQFVPQHDNLSNVDQSK